MAADKGARKALKVPLSTTKRFESYEPETMSFVMEIWSFPLARKKFWLLRILLAMVVLGGLVVLTKGSAVAPFIYTLS